MVKSAHLECTFKCIQKCTLKFIQMHSKCISCIHELKVLRIENSMDNPAR